MNVLIYIRFILGILFILISLSLFIIEIIGVFKMKYVLNRMHQAAIGDALALLFAVVGLVLINGINFTTFKLFLAPLFIFFTSPVSSHLISQMEVSTSEHNDKFEKCNVRDLDRLKEEDK